MEMAKDKDDATIVRSTIDLGHNMGLIVVAEGVENAAAWEMLKAWGCDFAQGYYISRPLPPEEFVRWLTAAQSANVSVATA
jgi:EAL domain-containing protein (putative c-di-GMP-specific phosphodiesterase class I)